MGIIRDLTVRPRRVAVINANCELSLLRTIAIHPLARPVTDVPPINQSGPPFLPSRYRRRPGLVSHIIAQPFSPFAWRHIVYPPNVCSTSDISGLIRFWDDCPYLDFLIHRAADRTLWTLIDLLRAANKENVLLSMSFLGPSLDFCLQKMFNDSNDINKKCLH